MMTINILAVEDDLVDQMALRRLFERDEALGELTVVASVEAARNHLATGTFEVVIVDYRLGQATGFEVLEITGDLPVIFLTGSANVDVAVKAMKAGAFDFLVKDIHGKHLNLLPLTLRNALQRKAFERALQETQAQMRALEAENMRAQVVVQMVHDLSHDIRTPLTVLQTATYIVRNELDKLVATIDPAADQSGDGSIDKIHTYLDRVGKQIAHLQKMLLRMLEIARLDEAPELSMEAVDVNDLCADAIEFVQALPNASHLNFHSRFDHKRCNIPGDRFELYSALINLLENAVKYTPAQGHISVTTQCVPDGVVIEVADSGIGIAAEHLPHIFERFYRADKTRNTATGGFGLGLAKVRRIVELHHGTVTVESQPGQGTTFRISLPSLQSARRGQQAVQPCSPMQ
jgi:signal transduction histidine kinase